MEMTTQQKGKLAELKVFGELIKRGADLYLPVMDIGTDAILRREEENGTYTYLEIQVKSTEAKEQAGYFNIYDLPPRGYLFIVCVDMSGVKLKEYHGEPEIWIFPSRVFHSHGTGKDKDKHCLLPLPDKPRGESRTREEILDQYCASKHEDAWKLLTGSS